MTWLSTEKDTEIVGHFSSRTVHHFDVRNENYKT